MRIETARLLMRPIEMSDVDAVHSWRSDPEVARFMDFEPASHEECARWVRPCIDANETDPGVTICSMVLKETNEVIGWIGWGPASATKIAGGDVDFGFSLHRDSWGQGDGTETLQAVIDDVLEVEGVATFFGETDVHNHRSARVMTKVGMEPMGVAPWDCRLSASFDHLRSSFSA